jgi:hypothetical protein
MLSAALLVVFVLTPAHMHDQAHACAICSAVHLPCVQAGGAAPIGLLVVVPWLQLFEKPEHARYALLPHTDSRAPPA